MQEMWLKEVRDYIFRKSDVFAAILSYICSLLFPFPSRLAAPITVKILFS